MSNEKMIERLREMEEEYTMPYKYQIVLAWCIAKLMKEIDNE